MTGDISVAWLADHHTFADSVMTRTWRSLSRDPAWAAWLAANTAEWAPFVVITVEDRPTGRLQLRADTLSYYVPIGWVRAAAETHTLVRFSGDLFRDLYVRWASRRERPMPPAITDAMLAAVPGRLP